MAYSMLIELSVCFPVLKNKWSLPSSLKQPLLPHSLHKVRVWPRQDFCFRQKLEAMRLSNCSHWQAWLAKIFFFQNSSRFLQNSCPAALRTGTQAFFQRITESAELLTASTSTAFLLTKATRGQSGRKTLLHWVTQSWVGPATFVLFYASLTTRVPSLAPGAHIKMERENKLHRAVLWPPRVHHGMSPPHTYIMYMHTYAHINNKQIL